jgi:hypothetical protein
LPPDGVGKSGRLIRHRAGQAELIEHRTAMCAESSRFSVCSDAGGGTGLFTVVA